jgi:hypothetical protein
MKALFAFIILFCSGVCFAEQLLPGITLPDTDRLNGSVMEFYEGALHVDINLLASRILSNSAEPKSFPVGFLDILAKKAVIQSAIPIASGIAQGYMLSGLLYNEGGQICGSFLHAWVKLDKGWVIVPVQNLSLKAELVLARSPDSINSKNYKAVMQGDYMRIPPDVSDKLERYLEVNRN